MLRTDPAKFNMEAKRRGILAATVPGNLKGWEEVHKRCGVLPWADLWADAINYAENGRPLDVDSAFHIRRHVPEIGLYENWAKEFLINGTEPPPAGMVHKRPELAESYKQFAKLGSAALYGGPVGLLIGLLYGTVVGLTDRRRIVPPREADFVSADPVSKEPEAARLRQRRTVPE